MKHLGILLAISVLGLTTAGALITACSRDDAGEQTRAVRAPMLQQSFTIRLPTGTRVEDVAMLAHESLKLHAGATVNAKVVNVGTVITSLQAGSSVAALDSVATVQNAGTVVGELREGAEVPTPYELSWTFQPTDPTVTALSVYPGQTVTLGANSSTGQLFVYGGGKVIFEEGLHAIGQMSFEEGSTIETDGPAIIYVRDILTLRAQSANGGVFVAYSGSNPVTLQTNFGGTIVAPNAPVRVMGQTQSGTVFAKTIEVDASVVYTHKASESWSDVVAGTPDTSGVYEASEPLVLSFPAEFQPAVEEYFKAGSSDVSEARYEAAVDGIQALPEGAFAAAIDVAFDRTITAHERVEIVHLATVADSPAMIPFFVKVLSLQPPQGLNEETVNPHDRGLIVEANAISMALNGLCWLEDEGIQAARTPLLDTITHPFRFIRAQSVACIREIDKTELDAELQARIRPEDSDLLTMREAVDADFALTPQPVPNADEEDIEIGEQH